MKLVLCGKEEPLLMHPASRLLAVAIAVLTLETAPGISISISLLSFHTISAWTRHSVRFHCERCLCQQLRPRVRFLAKRMSFSLANLFSELLWRQYRPSGQYHVLA